MRKVEELSFLIVDDSVTIRKILASNLQKMGVKKIFQAKSGDEAFVVAKTEKIDIVLTDHNMVGTNGLGLVTKLRNDSKTENIFVIAISSEFDDSLKGQYQILGVSEFIHKPFSQTAFNSAVTAFLKSEDKNGGGYEKLSPKELQQLFSTGEFAVASQNENLEFDFGEKKLIVQIAELSKTARLYNMIELENI